METKIFDAIHSSSLYTKPEHTLPPVLKKYMNHSSICTGTEVTKNRKQRVKKFADENNYGVLVGSKNYRNDCWILWNKDDWRKVYGENHQIKTGVLYNRFGNQMPPNVCTTVILDDRDTKFRTMTSVMHLPAGVEKGSKLRNAKRFVAWNIEVRAWKRRVNKLAREHKVDGVHMVADWNMDWKKNHVRVLFKTVMPKFKCEWAGKKLPAGGSLYKRLIDFGFTKRQIVCTKAYLFEDDTSSDHRPVGATLKMKVNKKVKRRMKLRANAGTKFPNGI